MQMPAQNTPCGLNPVPLNKAKVPDAIYGRPWISHYVKVVVELVKVVHNRVQDTIDDSFDNSLGPAGPVCDFVLEDLIIGC